LIEGQSEVRPDSGTAIYMIPHYPV